MSKLPQSHQGKEKIAFWLLNPASKFESVLLLAFFLLLPTQLGKHFWPDFSIVSGIRIDYLSPTVYITDILLILLFTTFLSRLIKTVKIANLKTRISKLHLKSKILVSLLLLLFLLNIFLSMLPLLSFYGTIKLLEFIFFALYLAKTICYQFQLQRIAFLFAISSSFESLLAISQYLYQGSLNGIFYFLGERMFTGTTPGIANASLGGVLFLRPYATFPHPNVLAGYLLLSIVLVWNFLFYESNGWMKVFGAISLLISSIALLLSLSRITILLWILLVVAILVRKVFFGLKTKKKKIGGLLVAVIGLIIISYLPLTHEVVTRFSQTSLMEESVTQRSELLSASWRMIQQHPLFGVGLDNFIPSLALLQEPLPRGLYLQPVHNIFVLATAETGLFGVAVFFLLLVETLVRITKQETRSKGTCIVLFASVLIIGLFDHFWLTLQQGQLLFTVILGLSWAKMHKKTA